MFDKLLTSRWCIWIAALLGMLLTLPAMNMGLMGDDYLHWSLLTGVAHNPQPGSPFGLFTFADGDPVHNQTLMDTGKLVWWASDTLRIAFWRPLAEWSQWLDYQIWPSSPLLMHLHNLALYGVMIVLVGKLFLTLDADRRQAGMATVLFAGNMLHVFAVAWLASRNQMLCGILLTLTLLSYHRWRSGGSPAFAVLAALCLGLGLFSAEAAVQTAGYLFAYALFMEPGKPLWRRLAALLPFVVIVLAWKATHGHLGYGSVGSPGYVDPTSNLGGFLTSLLLRLPALMLAQWYGVSSLMFEQLSRGTQIVYAASGSAVLLLLAWAMHRLGVFRSRLACFYGLGSVLSLAPACAGYPFDRLTINADIGASGLLAIALLTMWPLRKTLKGWGQGSFKYLLMLVGVVHLVLFPLGKIGSSFAMKPINSSGEAAGPLALPQGQPQEHFLLLNPPSGEAVYYFPVTRQFHGMRNPATIDALGPNNQAMTISRPDVQTLRVTVEGGFKGTITRDVRRQPFKPGDTARMGDVLVTVEALTPDHWPLTVSYRFPNDLQNPHWRFFAWQDDGLHAVDVPKVGDTLQIATYDIGKVVMHYASKKS